MAIENFKNPMILAHFQFVIYHFGYIYSQHKKRLDSF